jgi:hypothetical protein
VSAIIHARTHDEAVFLAPAWAKFIIRHNRMWVAFSSLEAVQAFEGIGDA